MATLVIQMAATGNDWSLTRDTQFRTQLETSFTNLHGSGVISGGYVTKTAAFAVEVASGTKLFHEGVSLTLSAAASYSSLEAGTCYLWGKINVTRANPTLPATSDTYALTLTHNTTGTAPSADHFLLATIVAGTGGIAAQSDINQHPTGKYLPIERRVTGAENTALVIPEFDRWYVVQADFSAVGTFADPGSYVATLTFDTAGPIAVELASVKEKGVAAWRVLVPSDSGSSLTLAATPVYYGHGFSGTDLTDIAATWAAPYAEDPSAGDQAEAQDDLERRFRALVVQFVTTLGVNPVPALERDFLLGVAEAA